MSTFYASRTNPDIKVNTETYATIDLYLGSQSGSIPLVGYANQNAGFTCLLANPIILDISQRYVMALIKSQYDLTDYTTRYYSFSIYCDLLEYQYEFGNKTQLLYQTYGNRYVPASTTELQVKVSDISNVAWKFINPTQKVIKEISFWILDDTGAPLTTPLPPDFSYPTNLNILIKKVNSNVVAVTQL